MSSITFAQRVTATPDTLINVIEGESVLLNLQSEKYFGLDEIGTSMWQALTNSESIEHAFATLRNEYDVDEARLRQDLTELVEKLAAHGLVELT